jgi:hypothetical protein
MTTTVLIPSKNNSYQVGCRNCLFVSRAAAAGRVVCGREKKVPLSNVQSSELILPSKSTRELASIINELLHEHFNPIEKMCL